MAVDSKGEAKSEQAEYDINESREEYIARMALEGFEPSYPCDNELQVDIDTAEQRAAFDASFPILEREIQEQYAIGLRPAITASRSGGDSVHIRIALPFTMSAWERIAWQGALGSDPVRELLSCLRMHRGIDKPTLFMEAIQCPQ